MSKTNTRAKGNLGENIASIFLEKRGFTVIDRNYQKRWGELDIVCKKNGEIHFFEVKSVSRPLGKPYSEGHQPEENVHALKVRHIRRMIETYFLEKDYNPEQVFSFHVICVFMDDNLRKARVKWLQDIIL